ncbi:MAG: hypothetical protein ACYTDT_00080 [Planctomycetota bacterium]|jgi:hypothetical protein
MSEVIPEIMARAQRGICPTCGAPMNLAEAGRNTTCEFCGGGSQLKFTLREIEPDAEELQRPQIKGATRWLEKQAVYEECTCPGCGATIKANAAQGIQTCEHCGSQSKLETRLIPITTDDVPEPQERTGIDFENQRRDRLDYPWDVETEQLFWRILNEQDLPNRIKLAQKFENWGFINHTAAHFLPWLLKKIQSDHDAVALPAADVIGKLLCEGDPTLWPGVIQACRAAVFDVNGKASILHELGLGQGVCVKTLIDTAEYAAANGAREYACQALWAVNTLIGRNFDEHPVIAQIVLYRLFYVTGPVLGWALDAMRSSYLRGRFPTELLIHAIDELGHERPELIEHLLDSIYVPPHETNKDFEQVLEHIESAQSWAGRAAGFETLRNPIKDGALMDRAVRLIDKSLDEAQAANAAESALYRLVSDGEKTHQSIDWIIEKRGESLSDRIKREYICHNQETALLDTSEPYYWQSAPKREFDPDMQALIDDWKDGISDAVDKYRSMADATSAQRDEARRLDVAVFLREEPATLPIAQKVVEEQEEEQQEEVRQSQQHIEIEQLQEDYTKRMMELSQKMMTNAANHKIVQQCSDEMALMADDLQKKIQKITQG